MWADSRVCGLTETVGHVGRQSGMWADRDSQAGRQADRDSQQISK